MIKGSYQPRRDSIQSLCLLLLPVVAFWYSSANTRADGGWQGQVLSLRADNDFVFNTDRHYTHGAQLSYLSKDDDLPDWLHDFSHWVPVGFKIEAEKFGIAAAQEIYTPADLTATAVVQDDQPYAAWLYTTFMIERRGQLRNGLETMDHLRLDLGVIGPPAMGEQAQDLAHHIPPRGWGNQLNFEPGIDLQYDWSLLFRARKTDSPWSLDWIPFGNSSLGNVHTYLGVGSTARFGYNVPNHFEVAREDRVIDFGVYLFATLEGRWVIRNIFLDGNTFENSHSVQKDPLVGDASAGLTVVFEYFEVTAGVTVLSQQFKGQVGTDAYGTVVLTAKF